jgi:hypothetical protein
MGFQVSQQIRKELLTARLRHFLHSLMSLSLRRLYRQFLNGLHHIVLHLTKHIDGRFRSKGHIQKENLKRNLEKLNFSPRLIYRDFQWVDRAVSSLASAANAQPTSDSSR